MKVLIHLFLIIFLSSPFLSQQVTVTFNVNMSNVTVDPAGVHIAGDFQGWNPASSPMTNLGAGMWTIDVLIDSNSYQEYKFYNGNMPVDSELISGSPCDFGNGNRSITVGSSNMNTEAFCFGQCAPCGSSMIQFRVNMSMENVNSNGVHIAGSIQGWDPGTSPMDDADGDDIWIRNFILSPGSFLYKFINGNVWGQDEIAIPADCSDTGSAGGNRTIEVTADNDVILEAFCYNSCDPCAPDANVTFQVDMSNEAISPNGIHLVGAFQNWVPGSDMMTDSNSDNIYEITVSFPIGTYEYKYLNGNNWTGSNNEEESIPLACAVADNRIVTIIGDTILDPVCFNQCDWPCDMQLPAENINFRVNMNDETVSSNGVWLIGSFTNPNWHAGAVQLNDDDLDGIYSGEILIDGPEEIEYKFTNGNPFPGGQVDNSVEESSDFETEGCGISNGSGGWYRNYERDGNGTSLEVVCFNSCSDCSIGINEHTIAYDILVYPNPADQIIKIEFSEFGISHDLRIRDLSGKVISSMLDVSYKSINWNVLNLENGFYFLEIENEKGKKALHKIHVLH